MARCRVCGNDKDISYFYLCPSGNPRKVCKKCHTQQSIRAQQRNKDQYNARMRVWKSNNKYSSRNKEQTRRARIRQVMIDKIDYNEILMRDGAVCHICNCTVALDDFHYDHVIPLAKGGPHTTDNIKISHPHCNLVKGSKLIGKHTRCRTD